jgi:hypothetical protein
MILRSVLAQDVLHLLRKSIWEASFVQVQLLQKCVIQRVEAA